MKIAISHDWLNGERGGEKCLEALCELYPETDIYTLFCDRDKMPPALKNFQVRSSWIERLPCVLRMYRRYLPLFPAAIESFRLKDHNLVISTSHCAAKGIRKPLEACHICYCFTPMRYAWGQFDEYFGKKNFLDRGLIRLLIAGLRRWDLRVNARVDHFVAISEHVSRRIKTYYGRDAEVVYPPVDTDFYTPSANAARENFYLVVSALVPYKQIDLAVEAFNRSGRELVIIGDGPERNRLEKSARPNIRIMGWQPAEAVRDYYRKARGLIFPGEEDFGIVPLEMQACGGPVIAYGVGGARETVIEGETGIFFTEPAVESLLEALERFERRAWVPESARRQAEKFNRERFKTEFGVMVQNVLALRGGVRT